MTSNALRGRQADAEGEVANEGADSNSEHHPAVVSHEEQPVGVRILPKYWMLSTHMMKKL
jgi:hypothetical protein